MIRIDGAVVLYNSNTTIFENILSYLYEVNILYIIDNSEIKNNDLILKLKNISKCKYIDNQGNQGIAHALNVGAKLAIGDGANWLLTMDQDSRFEKNDLNKLIKNIDSSMGIVSPLHVKNELEIDQNKSIITMTSGNLLNLIIYEKIGPFEEKLFIDSVDTEYCLRLFKYGYKIKRVTDVILNHNLGELKTYTFFNKKFTSTNHNHIRRYYIMRNRLYIWKKYNEILPSFIKSDKKQWIKEMKKIILFEKKKILKLFYTLKGYIDYKKNKFGKLDDKK